MHLRFKLRAAAAVTVAMIAVQIGSVANAGGVLTHPPDKTYCAVQDNACGILFLYTTNKGTSHAHAVTRVAESGHPENIKVVLNWEDRHTGFWQTHATVTKSRFAESVEAELTFTCTEDRLYKFYSHHYKDGVKFKTLEGVEFRPCSDNPSVGPIELG